ncbi:MAG: hypothetical protein ACOCXA_01575 [Planctomycetota bacterium]
MRPVRHFLTTVVVLILSICSLRAEEVVYQMDKSIPCRVRVSTPEKVYTRTVVFPATSLLEVPQFFDENDLFVQGVGNTLIVHLRNPDFEGTLQVYDNDNRLYVLNILPEEQKKVDEHLIIRLPEPIADAMSVTSGDDDLVARVFRYYEHMLGAHEYADIEGVTANVVEDGEVKVGRRIYQDDDLALFLIKLYQGPGLRGYECLLRYAGTEPRRIDMQRLYFPGALSIYAPVQAFMDPANPTLDIEAGSSIRLFFVGR